jgi:hypothetical protein
MWWYGPFAEWEAERHKLHPRDKTFGCLHAGMWKIVMKVRLLEGGYRLTNCDDLSHF